MARAREGYSSFVDLQPLDRLTEAHIHSLNLPDDIGTRWRDLARQLGFREELINSIQDEKDSNKERCIAFLVKWMEREGQQGTCEKLATALEIIGLQNLAERLICPSNRSGGRMCIEIEKTIKLGDANQTQIMLVRDSTGKKKFLLWESEENEFESLFKELKNSVNATIHISVNTPELGTKILKTSEVKDFVEVSEELERLEEELSNIISNLEIGELKEESFPIPNKLDLLNRESRTLQELYTKVTRMTGEACKCDELVRRKFYDFTYHSLRAVHKDLCAQAAELQSVEETMKEKEKETLKKLLSYRKGRKEQVAHLKGLWIGLFSPPYHSQAAEARCTYTDTCGPSDSGFSSEENAWVDSQARELPHSIPPEAGVEVKPSKGPLEGGGVFLLRFDRSLPDAVTSAWASFGNKRVEVSKSCECSRSLYGESIPAGEVPGTVPVTITTKDGVYLGKTLFTYVDQKEEMSEMLKQIVKSRKLKGELFKMLGRQCETDESEENNTRTFGFPSDGQQRQAMDILQCLVYTAAEIGAEEFIQMIFSTSAGRIVFEAYKKESSLPEDVAEANGDEDIATFLRAITKRFSEEDTTSQGTSLLELARACACEEKEEKEEKEEQSVSWPCETDVKQLKKDDLSEREYFGDAETSSSDSEKERCDYEDQFEARFSAGHDPIHLGLDPSYQMTERDIYHYQLAEMIRDKWRDLARALKYTEANIDSIEKEQGSSIKECCIKVLVCWMRREGPNATVKKLASALSKVELRNVADELMCMDTNQVEIKDKEQGDEEENKTANEPAGSSTDNSNTTQTRKQDDGFDQVDAAAVINHPAPEQIVQLRDSQGESQPAVEEHKETNFEVPDIEVTLSITQSSLSSDEDSAAWEERKKKKSRKDKRAGNGQKNDDEKDEVNKLARENETTKNSIDNLKKEKSSLEENLEEERIAIKMTDDRFKTAISHMQTICSHFEEQKSKMRSKIEQLEKMLQDSELQCSTLRSKVSELEGELVIQRHQQQGHKEGGLRNSFEAATELEDDVIGATRNHLDTDQENRERRITIQLKRLNEKLQELTSLLQVPEVKEDKLKTAVKLDLLKRLSEVLQNMYSEIQAMVAETCKCNEDLKREFYDFAYHGLRAEHNDLVLRVRDLESSQAEMSVEEKKDFQRLQQYQNNRKRQIDRLEKVWRGLFSSPESLPEASSSDPTGGNNNSKKALSRNRTSDPGARQKQTKTREGATSSGTPPGSDEEKSEVCFTTIKKRSSRSTVKSIFRAKESKENMCFPVSYRTRRDSSLSQCFGQ